MGMSSSSLLLRASHSQGAPSILSVACDIMAFSHWRLLLFALSWVLLGSGVVQVVEANLDPPVLKPACSTCRTNTSITFKWTHVDHAVNSYELEYILSEDLKSLGGNAPKCPTCLLYTSPSPRDQRGSRMPSSA